MKEEEIRKPVSNVSIPRDWETKTLGELCNVFVGRDLKESNFSVTKDNIYKYPVYSNTVQDEGLYGYYDIEEYSGESLTIVGRGAGLGTAFTRKDAFGAIGRLLILFPKKDVSAHYITEYVNNKLNIHQESGGIPQLTGEQIANYKIAVPKYPEQKAIAHILGLMDTAINQNNQLIAQKELRKKWLMQNLLTGKKRLKGFGGEWELFQLDKVADVRDGTHESPEYFRDGIKFITSKNIKDGELDFSNISYISEEDAINFNKRSKVDKGDILMSMIGTIGNCVLIDFEPDFCVKNVGLIKPKKINANYLIQYFYSTLFQNYLLGKLDGGIQKFISLSGLRELKISVPTIKEQTAIAQVLQAADKEIQLLKTKTEKLRLQKKGMMQVLLTGKKRLKI